MEGAFAHPQWFRRLRIRREIRDDTHDDSAPPWTHPNLPRACQVPAASCGRALLDQGLPYVRAGEGPITPGITAILGMAGLLLFG